MDIAPLVKHFSSQGLVIHEARVIKASLEDAFVSATGIEVECMKKEKEKK
jgi:hypothetical protein